LEYTVRKKTLPPVLLRGWGQGRSREHLNSSLKLKQSQSARKGGGGNASVTAWVLVTVSKLLLVTSGVTAVIKAYRRPSVYQGGKSAQQEESPGKMRTSVPEAAVGKCWCALRLLRSDQRISRRAREKVTVNRTAIIFFRGGKHGR